ncbi:class I SAM-dependent methyltransferase [Actinoallomurus soli]|uniref:class I SAM-dependent methyltransferase n=1 Tax=Actinoallomurus soli TaxID=2952535 RepID=UPI002093CB99|nr:class I SAM-dependent methyltransferase [Actinoallomurus soli]MCO5972633.1 class I SAM-dependent methyltransferase [Actinoallomurus soli]
MSTASSPSPPDRDPEIVARRASSFGGHAAAYATERPGYPDEAVRWALEPVVARGSLRVLDLAAGTGKLTEALVPYATTLVAVEPDPGMLAELRTRLPDVRAVMGTAERIPLADGSVDAVLVGQALHWFDLDRALPEMARVLSPGGVLACLWNVDDHRVPWVGGLKQVSRSTLSLGDWQAERAFTPTPEFPAVEYAEFAHAQRRTAESMAATIRTHSHVLILPEDERAALMARILDYLHTTPETASGEFDLPIATVAIRSVLAG